MIPVTPIDSLNADQAREYKRAQALANCLADQTKVYTLYPPFDVIVKLFLDNNKKLIELCPDKNSNGTTITQSKDSLKTSIALNAGIICTRTTAYAISIADADLQAAVNHSTTSIHHLKDADILSFITRLSNTVLPLLDKPAFTPYAVTAEMLSSVTDSAIRFNGTIGKAAFADSKMSYYSASIDEVLKAIRGNVAQCNLLINFFQTDHPGFVKEYRKAIAIDYSNVRHSGIEGIVTNPLNGQPVAGATITGEGKKKIAKTDKKGYYKLVKLKVTDMTITVTAPGFDTQTFDVKIIRGKIIECNITLKGKLITLSATA